MDRMEQEFVLRALMVMLTLVFITFGFMLRRARQGHGPRAENFILLRIIRNLFRAEKRARDQK